MNLARLLKSEADEISALGGVELLERSVEEIFCMGGSFAQNFGENPEKVEPEWNILQDIKSAQYFTRRCPVKAVFVPWEAGAEVFTEMKNGENPVWYSMRRYAESVGYEVNRFRPDELGPRYLSLRNGKLRKILRLFLIGKNNDS